MKKAFTVICVVFAAVFVAASVLPFAGIIFYRGESSEQRALAAFPAIIEDGKLNLNFGTGFEGWFRDRFAFRNELVEANSAAMTAIFDTSPEDDVITGKDGWLFYADTVADYCREERLDDYGLARLVTSIRLENNYARSRGSLYIFTVAPNKSSIYPEMMSGRYTVNGGSSLLDRLTLALQGQGIPFCDLKASLLDAKAGGQLYYECDSHWNLLGSIVAQRALTETIRQWTGIDLPGSGRTEVTLSDAPREDDLLKMVRPLSPTRLEKYASDSSEALYTVKGRMRSLDDATIETENPAGTVSLLMYRDSFGRALIHPLSNVFANAKYVRSDPFDLRTLLDSADSYRTVVVREIVERNLTRLLEVAPVVPAPETDPIANGGGRMFDETEYVTETRGTFGDLTKVCGIIKNIPGEYSRVFVLVNDQWYEAFPFCEKDSRLYENGTCGFTFYIENGTAEIDNIIIQ